MMRGLGRALACCGIGVWFVLVAVADDRERAWNAAMDAGIAATEAGKLIEAKQHFEQALAVARAEPPAKSGIASSLNGLGACLTRLGRFDEAIPILEEAYAIFAEQLGPQHPNSVSPLNNLAVVYGELGQHDRALDRLSRTLAIERQHYGETSPQVGATRIRLGNSFTRSRQYAAAEAEYAAAIAIFDSGAESPDVSVDLRGALSGLGNLYREMGRLKESQEVLERAAKLRPEAADAVGLQDAMARLNLAGAKLANGEAEAALPLLRQGLTELRRFVGEDFPAVGATEMNIGIAEVSLGRFGPAAESFARACRLLDSALPDGHRDHQTCLKNQARVLAALGRDAEAAAVRQQMESRASK